MSLADFLLTHLKDENTVEDKMDDLKVDLECEESPSPENDAQPVYAKSNAVKGENYPCLYPNTFHIQCY